MDRGEDASEQALGVDSEPRSQGAVSWAGGPPSCGAGGAATSVAAEKGEFRDDVTTFTLRMFRQPWEGYSPYPTAPKPVDQKQKTPGGDRVPRRWGGQGLWEWAGSDWKAGPLPGDWSSRESGALEGLGVSPGDKVGRAASRQEKGVWGFSC